MIKKIVIANLFLIVGLQVQAQLIKQTFSLGELNPYLTAYAAPFAKSMATGMSGGWTYTAKTHQFAGFDLTIGGSYIPVPPSEMIFNPRELDMPGYSFTGREAPTISSSEKRPFTLITKEFINDIPFGFSVPVLDGLGLSYGAMVNLQLGVGLPFGTELLVRYIPDISRSVNGLIEEEIEFRRTGLLGGGIKHDLKQWIPGYRDIPFIETSVLFTYSGFYSGFSGEAMRVDPGMLGVYSDLPDELWEGQVFEVNMSSFSGSFLIGGDFPLFKPFVGLGFGKSNFTGELQGNFPIVEFTLQHPTGVVDAYEVNPLKINETVTDFNLQAGGHFKLGFIALYYIYTFQNYSMHSAGISFSFR